MATMIKFKEDEDLGGNSGYGILLDDDTCICGCCGGLLEKGEFEILEMLEWIDIQDAIKGE